jgi:hypothetical protein
LGYSHRAQDHRRQVTSRSSPRPQAPPRQPCHPTHVERRSTTPQQARCQRHFTRERRIPAEAFSPGIIGQRRNVRCGSTRLGLRSEGPSTVGDGAPVGRAPSRRSVSSVTVSDLARSGRICSLRLGKTLQRIGVRRSSLTGASPDRTPRSAATSFRRERSERSRRAFGIAGEPTIPDATARGYRRRSRIAGCRRSVLASCGGRAPITGNRGGLGSTARDWVGVLCRRLPWRRSMASIVAARGE